MNREIKFRAWDKAAKRMLYSYIPDDQPKREYIFVEFGVGFSIYNPNDFIIMQYTGLKDKNGKEIYEGDILKDNGGKLFYIAFHKGRYCGIYDKIFISCDGFEYFKKNEIVGNIHENPGFLIQENKDG